MPSRDSGMLSQGCPRDIPIYTYAGACARVSGPTHSLLGSQDDRLGLCLYTPTHMRTCARPRKWPLGCYRHGLRVGSWPSAQDHPTGYWCILGHAPTRRCDHWLHTIGSSTHCASTWFRWFWRFWPVLALFVIFPPNISRLSMKEPQMTPKRGHFGPFSATFGPLLASSGQNRQNPRRFGH